MSLYAGVSSDSCDGREKAAKCGAGYEQAVIARQYPRPESVCVYWPVIT